MANNITVDDSYIKEYADFAKKYGATFDTYYEKYISKLENIQENGIVEGETAKAIEAYTDTVKALRNRVSDTTELLEQVLNHYVDDIDTADRYLY